MNFHAAVWLDHRLAKIIGFNLHSAEHDTQTVKSHSPEHLHHKAGTMGSGHAHDDPAYFKAIAHAIINFKEVLLLGPADAKSKLQNFLRREFPELAVHIVGNEAMEQQSDGEIVKFARDFFHRADRMTPQK